MHNAIIQLVCVVGSKLADRPRIIQEQERNAHLPARRSSRRIHATILAFLDENLNASSSMTIETRKPVTIEMGMQPGTIAKIVSRIRHAIRALWPEHFDAPLPAMA